MSELKAFVARKIDEGTCDPVPCVEVYLKFEADKVIADLEESHKMEVEQLLMEIVELKKQVHDYAQGLYVMQARAEKEARHDKYKRCLDNAKWCKLWYEEEKYDWKKKDAHHWFRVSLYDKWHKRWLGLAEKFKEAK